MSAPSIPNLLSLKGRGGGAGRGLRGSRGVRSRGGPRSASASPGQSDDHTIQDTDTDAAVSRFSAVELGYLDDPFARYFVSAVDGPPPRRFPIINRGTYTRTAGIDHLIHAYMSGHSKNSTNTNHPLKRQIVSLGAGTDTRPFRLFSQQSHYPDVELVYHEIDFPVTCAKKLRTVQATPALSSILSSRSSRDEGPGNWSSNPASGWEYHSHGLDIRDLSVKILDDIPGLRTDVPTLVLSECCLCYLTLEDSQRVLSYFSARIADLATVIYEPVHLGDPFSDTMTSNLAARNIHMPSLERRRGPDDQRERLRDAGFDKVSHETVSKIWETWVPQEEKERVDGLEGLDEVEEWKLLAGHYIVVWSTKGPQLEYLDKP